jgi:hypothetical protein
LHWPSEFAAVSPGAGFTSTHGYVKNLGKLPEYQERTLRIYDAQEYAENAFNVPIVAYSGEKDGQKAAADNIEKRLNNFPEPLRFTHLIAPGLEHKQPPEWLAKIEDEFQKYVPQGKAEYPKRVRFVTYTLRYPICNWVVIQGMEKQYERAFVDATATEDGFEIQTTNVTELMLFRKTEAKQFPASATIDAQTVVVPDAVRTELWARFAKVEGKWKSSTQNKQIRKRAGLQGPIDDVFHTPFFVVGPTGKSENTDVDAYTRAAQQRMAREWDKFLRGKMPENRSDASRIFFGDPMSNPELKEVLPHLPITWTADTLTVNGKKYDAKTHVPVMIYPDKRREDRYLVLNSGHTFHEADFKATNAMLFPRLGDWAVLKPTPTKEDPAAAEVVDAGIFDENWQFAK